MIVDSTALPEQVVDDVIASGFQSAGQRCSALRVLFVQEEIADKIINMIKGAMQELHVGDPSYLSTDVGPVIDLKAHSALCEHVDYLKNRSTLHHVCNTDHLSIIENNETAPKNYFFAPRLYEIDDLSVLKKEVFGPIVHVIRYKAENIENVIDQINGTGFGLTMGIHTRIEEKSQYLTARSRAGNIYVNRNMIGAVVGVQPFGGRGLSGTGPKAGGPHYLKNLVKLVEDENYAEVKQSQIELPENDTNIATNVESLTAQAKSIELEWSFTPLSQRISIIRQCLAQLSTNMPLSVKEATLANSLTLVREKLLLIEKKLENPSILPGPTGESNVLHLESRGLLVNVICNNTSFEFNLASITSAIACGNTVIVATDDSQSVATEIIVSALIKSGLPRGIINMTHVNNLPVLLKHPAISGAVISRNSTYSQYVNERVSGRKGAILPVIIGDATTAMFNKMLTEKTVTIDTTAAGGNASLMTM